MVRQIYIITSIKNTCLPFFNSRILGFHTTSKQQSPKMLPDIAHIKPAVSVMEKDLVNPKSSRIKQKIQNFHKISCKA